MKRGKRSLGRSKVYRPIVKGSELLNDAQRNLIDLDTPYLILHSNCGALVKVSIYL